VVAAEKRVSWPRILVLAALVAALGGYLWFYEVPQARKEAEKEKLVGVADDAVTGIELVYADRTIGLAKGDGGWRLTKPVEAPADEPVVKTLLTAITGAQVQKTLDEVPADLAPFGLDKPATTITLATKDGPLPAIALGKNTAIGAKTYVRKGDAGKVYLTASTLQTAINKQARDLRDKQLLRVPGRGRPADRDREAGARRWRSSAGTRTRGRSSPRRPADATEMRSTSRRSARRARPTSRTMRRAISARTAPPPRASRSRSRPARTAPPPSSS
jgi:hypothetical protein